MQYSFLWIWFRNPCCYTRFWGRFTMAENYIMLHPYHPPHWWGLEVAQHLRNSLQTQHKSCDWKLPLFSLKLLKHEVYFHNWNNKQRAFKGKSEYLHGRDWLGSEEKSQMSPSIINVQCGVWWGSDNEIWIRLLNSFFPHHPMQGTCLCLCCNISLTCSGLADWIQRCMHCILTG